MSHANQGKKKRKAEQTWQEKNIYIIKKIASSWSCQSYDTGL